MEPNVVVPPVPGVAAARAAGFLCAVLLGLAGGYLLKQTLDNRKVTQRDRELQHTMDHLNRADMQRVRREQAQMSFQDLHQPVPSTDIQSQIKQLYDQASAETGQDSGGPGTDQGGWMNG